MDTTTPEVKTGQLFAVPADQAEATGMHVAGGWHSFLDHVEHGITVLLPLLGNYQMLQGLGFKPLGVHGVQNIEKLEMAAALAGALGAGATPVGRVLTQVTTVGVTLAQAQQQAPTDPGMGLPTSGPGDAG